MSPPFPWTIKAPEPGRVYMIVNARSHPRGRLQLAGWIYTSDGWDRLVELGWLRARLPVEPCKALPLSQVPERIKN